jgi:parvulin-like peptidyl-prolyl isomerase
MPLAALMSPARSPRALSLALLLALAACDGGGAGGPAAPEGGPAAAAGPDIGQVIATVNGVPVGSLEFEEAAARKRPAEGDALSLAEKKEVLDRLVEEKLLYKAALAKGLDKDPKVQKVMVNTLLRNEVYANVRNQDFSDELLQAYYEQHKDEFVVPEKVQIKRILIKTDKRGEEEAKSMAEKLHAELKGDPAKFKDVAAKASEDPYRRRGGDVGFVARTGKPGLEQAVVDKAFEMNVEQLSAPFKTEEGYNLIYVANKREKVERTFQQMKGSVLRKVKNEKLKELYDSYVASLKTGAKVDIDEAKLTAIEIKATRAPQGPGGVTLGGPGEEMAEGGDPMEGAAPDEGEE